MRHLDELNALERAFVEASTALEAKEADAERRRTRRARRVAALLAVLLVAAVATSVVAIRSSNLATSRQLAGTASSLLQPTSSDERRNVAALLSIEALHIAPTVEAYTNVVSLSADSHYATPLTADGAEGIDFSPNGRLLATGTKQGATIWDVARRKSVAKVPYPDTVDVAFIPPAGRMLAAAIHSLHTQLGDEILLWDTARRKVAATLPAGHTVLDMAFSPDGRLLASAEVLHNLVSVWVVGSRARLAQLPGAGGELKGLAFNNDGILAVAGGKIVTLWDLRPPGPARLAVLTGQADEISDVAFSSDGNMLASASLDKTVVVWDVDRPERPRRLATLRHDDRVEDVAFGPAGQVASVTTDRVTLWDIASRTPRAILTQGFSSEMIMGDFYGSSFGDDDILAFSPDGHSIATSTGQEAVLWDLDADRVAARICKKIGRNLTRSEWAQYVPNRRYHKTCK